MKYSKEKDDKEIDLLYEDIKELVEQTRNRVYKIFHNISISYDN